MISRRVLLLASPVLLLVAACGGPATRPSPASHQAAVPIQAFQDWAAWVNRMPPGPRSLHVSGSVQLPGPGYRPRLVPVENEADPKTLTLALEIDAPETNQPEQPTWHDVTYSFDDYQGDYSSVLVLREGAPLTDVSGNPLNPVAVGAVY